MHEQRLESVPLRGERESEREEPNACRTIHTSFSSPFCFVGNSNVGPHLNSYPYLAVDLGVSKTRLLFCCVIFVT